MTKREVPVGELSNIFTLHGGREKVATQAVGFVLANSPAFLDKFIESLKDDIKISDRDVEEIKIELQKHRVEQVGEEPRWGFTDIEVGIEGKFCVIIEAKKGWGAAHKDQLQKYAYSFTEADGDAYLMTISQSDKGEHETIPGSFKKDIPVIHRSWGKIQDIVKHARKGWDNSEWENSLLTHLYVHLTKYVAYDRGNVCIVPLSAGRKASQKYSFREIVTKGNGYFHPIDRYPEEQVPEYLGFRWRAKLHLLHKIKHHQKGSEFRATGTQSLPQNELMWTDEGENEDEGEGSHMIYKLDRENLLSKERQIPAGKINHRGMQWCHHEMLRSGEYNSVEEVVNVMEGEREKREKESVVYLRKFLNGECE